MPSPPDRDPGADASVAAELSSLAHGLAEAHQRLRDLADGYADARRDEVASALVAAERAVRGAVRDVERARALLR